MSQNSAVPPATLQFATPDHYRLSGGSINITYKPPVGDGGLAHLQYQDAQRTLYFTGDQIRTVNVPDLGTIVSVTLLLTVDSGSTTFSALIPHVNLPDRIGASALISTEGNTTSHRFSAVTGLNLGQQELYTITHLTGTASLEGISPRAIQFAAYTWVVKSSLAARVGPGPNYFSDSTDNVWVDSRGQLHLKITKGANGWNCAEVYLARSLGYGTYRFYLNSTVDNLDPNVVLGLYTWDNSPSDNHREMDIEFSRWGDPNPTHPNAQYVVQPYTVPENKVRFNEPPNVPQSNHSLHWGRGRAEFLSIGQQTPPGPPSTIIMRHTFTSGVPTPGAETVHINLWLDHGSAPTDGKPVEIVISKFEFAP